MTWHVFPGGEIERLAPQWDALNVQGANSPLLTSRFLMSALRVFGTGRERLVCLGDRHAPDCMAVVVERKRGVWETFQPSQAPIGFWLMRAGLDVAATLHGLMRALPGLPLVAGITQQDPELLPRPGDSDRLSTLDYIETARILPEGGFDAYWDARGKNLRHNMRKARNRLERAGLALRLDCITDPALMGQAIADYGRLETSGWKAKNGTAVSPDNSQGQFYLDLLEAHCRAGHGRIYRLMFNDTVAAMDLCVDWDGVIVLLKTAYDEAMSDYSPAMLMHHGLFQSIFDSGEFRRIEFYGKVLEWQTRFTEDKRTIYHLNAYRWGWVKRLLAKDAPLAAGAD
ncbi:MAG: GNAT family N-acetyltransferase [Sulfuricella sp.]|nr:GNAT family N-acetyltransferase [Sulfuricella sp.]